MLSESSEQGNHSVDSLVNITKDRHNEKMSVFFVAKCCDIAKKRLYLYKYLTKHAQRST